jgi:threonine dehydratase
MRIVRATASPRIDLLPTDDDLAFARATVSASRAVSPVTMLRRELGGRRTWLALECLQPVGSFKVRGAIVALARMKERGVDRVVAVSAGNHGGGVAAAAAELAIAATVVVPRTAPRKKVDKIRALGGSHVEVIEEGEGYDAAEAFALALAEERGLPFVSPYDDVAVVAGNGGSLALEIEEAIGATPSLVLAPFGGGGLATGLACGFATPRIVWGVQSEASPAFAMSLERGSAVTTLPFVETLADGIEGGIAADAFARAAGVCAGVIVVSEDAIAEAMRFAYGELGLVVEGSAAVALVPLLPGFGGLPPEMERERTSASDGDVVVVLTGRNVDRDRLARLVW